jgi:hypothetical protein
MPWQSNSKPQGKAQLDLYLAAIDIPLTAAGLHTLGATVSLLESRVYDETRSLYLRARSVAGLSFMDQEDAIGGLLRVIDSNLPDVIRAEGIESLSAHPMGPNTAELIAIYKPLQSSSGGVLRQTLERTLKKLAVKLKADAK